MEDLLLPCLNKSLFGIECHGCGLQRSILLFFSGNFKAAFLMFPAIYPILALLLFLIFNLFYKFKNDHKYKLGLLLGTAMVLAISYSIKMMSLLIN